MKLADLETIGCFVDTQPVKKEITWKTADGKKHTFDVFVVRQPFGAVEQAVTAVDRCAGANLIHLCIRLGEQADERLTYEQAYNLAPALAWAFVSAINEVNAPKKA